MSKCQRPRRPATTPDRVLSLRQFAELNGISLRTARRLIEADAVPVVQLSARRVGVRESDAARYQAERIR